MVDLETTGFPPDAEPIEIGAVDVQVRPLALPAISDEPRWALVRPGRRIPPESSAVHHLIDEDLVDCRRWAEVWPLFVSPAIDAYAAHTAKFERAFLTEEMLGGRPWICTWKCALRLWPEAPSHSNHALRYWLKPAGIRRDRAALAHRAYPDAYVTAHLLALMLEQASVEQLVEWSAKPALLARVPFGNWRGHPWADVDDGFLDWVLRRDFDEDVIFTARTEVERREREREATEDDDELSDEEDAA